MVVDSVSVERSVSPRTIDEMAGFFRESIGRATFVGGGTQLGAGNPLGPVDTVVRTDKLDRITEYVPADLTIHVEAGVRVGTLLDTLGERGQLLPLDPWNGPEATIGGIVATNAQGALRTVGTIRDWIIGMKVVHPDGRMSKTGGRVVKNVSGYDLAKLYTGSIGSLGAIAEVSFKLRAAWEATATACLRVADPDDAVRIVREIRLGPVQPIAFVWTGPPDTVAVKFGEHPDAVRWQLGALPAGDWKHLDGEGERAFWGRIAGGYNAMPDPVVRVVARPSDLAGVIRDFTPSNWIAHAGLGTVMMSVGASGFPERLRALRSRFPCVIERARVEDRRSGGTFGVSGAAYDLMARLKHALDPEGRSNPGRHVDGERPWNGET